MTYTNKNNNRIKIQYMRNISYKNVIIAYINTLYDRTLLMNGKIETINFKKLIRKKS